MDVLRSSLCCCKIKMLEQIYVVIERFAFASGNEAENILKHNFKTFAEYSKGSRNCIKITCQKES